MVNSEPRKINYYIFNYHLYSCPKAYISGVCKLDTDFYVFYQPDMRLLILICKYIVYYAE